MTTHENKRDAAFLGHPAGLGWISFTEFWERFSYYGMLTLLVLYMTHQLLLPGHVEHVWGFAFFRHVLEHVFGPLSPQALASQTEGLYAGFVYLMPIGGGILADRFIGRTHAITLGALLMALGHFLMAFDTSFLLALLCLLLGVGCFKGNLATQVGDLYKKDDPRRADGFQIYYLGIQLAVIGSPIICGRLASNLGWHWGFGAAGIGMLIGLTVYLMGRPSLPADQPRLAKGNAPAQASPTRADKRNIAVLVGIMPLLALAGCGNLEIFNAYMVWAEKTFDFSGLGIKVTDLISFDSIVSTTTMAGVVLFWRWWAKRWTEPDELQKMVIGIGLGAVAPLALAAASGLFAASGHRVSLWWAVAFELLNDIGFANVLPVGLALYSRAAPKGLESTVVSVYFLHLFLGNVFVGWLGAQYEKTPAATFWLIHVAIMLGAGAVLLSIRMTAGRALSPAYEAPQVEAA